MPTQTPSPDAGIDPESGGTTEIDLDALFHILQNERRRLTLRYLSRSGQTDLGSIADQVAAWEHDVDVESVSEDQRKRTYISLYQSHLPTLADHDVVEYDSDSNVVTPRQDIQRFEAYLDGLPSTRDGDTASRAFGLDSDLAVLATLAIVGLGLLAVSAGGFLEQVAPLVGVGLVGLAVAYGTVASP